MSIAGSSQIGVIYSNGLNTINILVTIHALDSLGHPVKLDLDDVVITDYLTGVPIQRADLIIDKNNRFGDDHFTSTPNNVRDWTCSYVAGRFLQGGIKNDNGFDGTNNYLNYYIYCPSSSVRTQRKFGIALHYSGGRTARIGQGACDSSGNPSEGVLVRARSHIILTTEMMRFAEYDNTSKGDTRSNDNQPISWLQRNAYLQKINGDPLVQFTCSSAHINDQPLAYFHLYGWSYRCEKYIWSLYAASDQRAGNIDNSLKDGTIAIRVNEYPGSLCFTCFLTWSWSYHITDTWWWSGKTFFTVWDQNGNHGDFQWYPGNLSDDVKSHTYILGVNKTSI